MRCFDTAVTESVASPSLSLNRQGHYSLARAGYAADLDLMPCRSTLCGLLGWAYRVLPWPRT